LHDNESRCVHLIELHFCKVGQHSFIGGGRVVLQDVPPYILANGEPLQYSGLNSIGLRRRNFDLESRNLIKKAYKILYLSHFNRSQAIDEIKNKLKLTNEIKLIIEFIENSDRGLI
jgi:UDP-N-acetylglucosamine acyltransferase